MGTVQLDHCHPCQADCLCFVIQDCQYALFLGDPPESGSILFESAIICSCSLPLLLASKIIDCLLMFDPDNLSDQALQPLLQKNRSRPYQSLPLPSVEHLPPYSFTSWKIGTMGHVVLFLPFSLFHQLELSLQPSQSF